MILPSLQSEHCYSRAELHIIEKFNNLFKNFDLPPNKDKISRFEKIALAKKENFQPSIVTSVQCSDDDMGHNSKSLQKKKENENSTQRVNKLYFNLEKSCPNEFNQLKTEYMIPIPFIDIHEQKWRQYFESILSQYSRITKSNYQICRQLYPILFPWRKYGEQIETNVSENEKSKKNKRVKNKKSVTKTTSKNIDSNNSKGLKNYLCRDSHPATKCEKKKVDISIFTHIPIFCRTHGVKSKSTTNLLSKKEVEMKPRCCTSLIMLSCHKKDAEEIKKAVDHILKQFEDNVESHVLRKCHSTKTHKNICAGTTSKKNICCKPKNDNTKEVNKTKIKENNENISRCDRKIHREQKIQELIESIKSIRKMLCNQKNPENRKDEKKSASDPKLCNDKPVLDKKETAGTNKKITHSKKNSIQSINEDILNNKITIDEEKKKERVQKLTDLVKTIMLKQKCVCNEGSTNTEFVRNVSLDPAITSENKNDSLDLRLNELNRQDSDTSTSRKSSRKVSFLDDDSQTEPNTINKNMEGINKQEIGINVSEISLKATRSSCIKEKKTEITSSERSITKKSMVSEETHISIDKNDAWINTEDVKESYSKTNEFSEKKLNSQGSVQKEATSSDDEFFDTSEERVIKVLSDASNNTDEPWEDEDDSSISASEYSIYSGQVGIDEKIELTEEDSKTSTKSLFYEKFDSESKFLEEKLKSTKQDFKIESETSSCIKDEIIRDESTPKRSKSTSDTRIAESAKSLKGTEIMKKNNNGVSKDFNDIPLLSLSIKEKIIMRISKSEPNLSKTNSQQNKNGSTAKEFIEMLREYQKNDESNKKKLESRSTETDKEDQRELDEKTSESEHDVSKKSYEKKRFIRNEEKIKEKKLQMTKPEIDMMKSKRNDEIILKLKIGKDSQKSNEKRSDRIENKQNSNQKNKNQTMVLSEDHKVNNTKNIQGSSLSSRPISQSKGKTSYDKVKKNENKKERSNKKKTEHISIIDTSMKAKISKDHKNLKHGYENNKKLEYKVTTTHENQTTIDKRAANENVYEKEEHEKEEILRTSEGSPSEYTAEEECNMQNKTKKRKRFRKSSQLKKDSRPSSRSPDRKINVEKSKTISKEKRKKSVEKNDRNVKEVMEDSTPGRQRKSENISKPTSTCEEQIIKLPRKQQLRKKLLKFEKMKRYVGKSLGISEFTDTTADNSSTSHEKTNIKKDISLILDDTDGSEQKFHYPNLLTREIEKRIEIVNKKISCETLDSLFGLGYLLEGQKTECSDEELSIKEDKTEEKNRTICHNIIPEKIDKEEGYDKLKDPRLIDTSEKKSSSPEEIFKSKNIELKIKINSKQKVNIQLNEGKVIVNATKNITSSSIEETNQHPMKDNDEMSYDSNDQTAESEKNETLPSILPSINEDYEDNEISSFSRGKGGKNEFHAKTDEELQKNMKQMYSKPQKIDDIHSQKRIFKNIRDGAINQVDEDDSKIENVQMNATGKKAADVGIVKTNKKNAEKNNVENNFTDYSKAIEKTTAKFSVIKKDVETSIDSDFNDAKIIKYTKTTENLQKSRKLPNSDYRQEDFKKYSNQNIVRTNIRPASATKIEILSQRDVDEVRQEGKNGEIKLKSIESNKKNMNFENKLIHDQRNSARQIITKISVKKKDDETNTSACTIETEYRKNIKCTKSTIEEQDSTVSNKKNEDKQDSTENDEDKSIHLISTHSSSTKELVEIIKDRYFIRKQYPIKNISQRNFSVEYKRKQTENESEKRPSEDYQNEIRQRYNRFLSAEQMRNKIEIPNDDKEKTKMKDRTDDSKNIEKRKFEANKQEYLKQKQMYSNIEEKENAYSSDKRINEIKNRNRNNEIQRELKISDMPTKTNDVNETKKSDEDNSNINKIKSMESNTDNKDKSKQKNGRTFPREDQSLNKLKNNDGKNNRTRISKDKISNITEIIERNDTKDSQKKEKKVRTSRSEDKKNLEQNVDSPSIKSTDSTREHSVDKNHSRMVRRKSILIDEKDKPFRRKLKPKVSVVVTSIGMKSDSEKSRLHRIEIAAQKAVDDILKLSIEKILNKEFSLKDKESNIASQQSTIESNSHKGSYIGSQQMPKEYDSEEGSYMSSQQTTDKGKENQLGKKGDTEKKLREDKIINEKSHSTKDEIDISKVAKYADILEDISLDKALEMEEFLKNAAPVIKRTKKDKKNPTECSRYKMIELEETWSSSSLKTALDLSDEKNEKDLVSCRDLNLFKLQNIEKCRPFVPITKKAELLRETKLEERKDDNILKPCGCHDIGLKKVEGIRNICFCPRKSLSPTEQTKIQDNSGNVDECFKVSSSKTQKFKTEMKTFTRKYLDPNSYKNVPSTSRGYLQKGDKLFEHNAYNESLSNVCASKLNARESNVSSRFFSACNVPTKYTVCGCPNKETETKIQTKGSDEECPNVCYSKATENLIENEPKSCGKNCYFHKELSRKLVRSFTEKNINIRRIIEGESSSDSEDFEDSIFNRSVSIKYRSMSEKFVRPEKCTRVFLPQHKSTSLNMNTRKGCEFNEHNSDNFFKFNNNNIYFFTTSNDFSKINLSDSKSSQQISEQNVEECSQIHEDITESTNVTSSPHECSKNFPTKYSSTNSSVAEIQEISTFLPNDLSGVDNLDKRINGVPADEIKIIPPITHSLSQSRQENSLLNFNRPPNEEQINRYIFSRISFSSPTIENDVFLDRIFSFNISNSFIFEETSFNALLDILTISEQQILKHDNINETSYLQGFKFGCNQFITKNAMSLSYTKENSQKIYHHLDEGELVEQTRKKKISRHLKKKDGERRKLLNHYEKQRALLSRRTWKCRCRTHTKETNSKTINKNHLSSDYGSSKGTSRDLCLRKSSSFSYKSSKQSSVNICGVLDSRDVEIRPANIHPQTNHYDQRKKADLEASSSTSMQPNKKEMNPYKNDQVIYRASVQVSKENNKMSKQPKERLTCKEATKKMFKWFKTFGVRTNDLETIKKKESDHLLNAETNLMKQRKVLRSKLRYPKSKMSKLFLHKEEYNKLKQETQKQAGRTTIDPVLKKIESSEIIEPDYDDKEEESSSEEESFDEPVEEKDRLIVFSEDSMVLFERKKVYDRLQQYGKLYYTIYVNEKDEWDHLSIRSAESVERKVECEDRPFFAHYDLGPNDLRVHVTKDTFQEKKRDAIFKNENFVECQNSQVKLSLMRGKRYISDLDPTKAKIIEIDCTNQFSEIKICYKKTSHSEECICEPPHVCKAVQLESSELSSLDVNKEDKSQGTHEICEDCTECRKDPETCENYEECLDKHVCSSEKRITITDESNEHIETVQFCHIRQSLIPREDFEDDYESDTCSNEFESPRGCMSKISKKRYRNIKRKTYHKKER